MPELPEVQTVIDTLAPHVTGATIVGVHVLRDDYVRPPGAPFSRHLIGRRIMDLRRRGKRILLHLDDANRLLIHLGMTGQITVVRGPTFPARHTHVILILRQQGGDPSTFQVHFRDPRRFGQLCFLGPLDGEQGLGPEPLELTPRKLAEIFKGSRRAVKAVLLDQSRMAGLGNIYADESLFAAAIDPRTPAAQLRAAELGRLCRTIKQVLRKAMRLGGSSVRDYVDAQGAKGSYQTLHKVYGRAGLPCYHCGTELESLRLAGRTTCFCPKCQHRQRMRTK